MTKAILHLPSGGRLLILAAALATLAVSCSPSPGAGGWN